MNFDLVDRLLMRYRALRRCVPRVVLIPHHGARSDYNGVLCKELYYRRCKYYEKCCFCETSFVVSYGLINNFGHPNFELCKRCHPELWQRKSVSALKQLMSERIIATRSSLDSKLYVAICPFETRFRFAHYLIDRRNGHVTAETPRYELITASLSPNPLKRFFHFHITYLPTLRPVLHLQRLHHKGIPLVDRNLPPTFLLF